MTGAPQQPFPRLDTPLVDPVTGAPSIPWYRFFITLWKKTGGSFPTVFSVVLQQAPNGGTPISAYDAGSGNFIATLATAGAPLPPAVLVIPNPSPFTYKAPANGTLFVSSGRISISRDAGITYYQASLTGGPVPMASGDEVLVEWFSTVPPTAVFFSGGNG